jgi:hypothetical protein
MVRYLSNLDYVSTHSACACRTRLMIATLAAIHALRILMSSSIATAYCVLRPAARNGYCVEKGLNQASYFPSLERKSQLDILLEEVECMVECDGSTKLSQKGCRVCSTSFQVVSRRLVILPSRHCYIFTSTSSFHYARHRPPNSYSGRAR